MWGAGVCERTGGVGALFADHDDIISAFFFPLHSSLLFLVCFTFRSFNRGLLGFGIMTGSWIACMFS